MNSAATFHTTAGACISQGDCSLCPLLNDAIGSTNKTVSVSTRTRGSLLAYNCDEDADGTPRFVSGSLVSAADLSASLVFLKSNLGNACILDKRRTFGERKFIIRYLEVC